MIEIKNVTFNYKGETEGGLKNLSLTIEDGEVVLLCGASGCGKTTITRLINGLIPHYYKGELKGTVLIDGKNPARTELYNLASKVGTVFQNPRSQFFSTDTDGEITFSAENVGMNKKEINERKDKIVNEMKINRLLDRSIFDLSGGEKQIIACASVNLLSPNIIVLDEPSSNLDSEAIDRLRKIIKLWKEQGKTIIIAEHRLYFMRDLADRMIIMKNGEIVNEIKGDEIKALDFTKTESLGLRPLSLDGIIYHKNDYSSDSNMITLENFRFTYSDKKHGINIPRLDLPVNSIVAIIGNNGAGKTTFVRNICGLEKRCKGRMELDGKKLKSKGRLHNCYMIMQDVNHQLFTSSVNDEVMLSITDKKLPLKEKEERSLAILKDLDLLEYKDTHPMALSGGQKQRTAIASGIASSKPIIILDEPTSGLDLAHMKQVSDQIIKLHNKGKTLFIVTHDLEFILSCCNYVVHLENGMVKENYPLNDTTYKTLKGFFINNI